MSLFKKSFPRGGSLKVAMSFDSRKTSKEFSEIVSEVWLSWNKSLPTKTSTNSHSFMVRHFDCHAGICITASVILGL